MLLCVLACIHGPACRSRAEGGGGASPRDTLSCDARAHSHGATSARRFASAFRRSHGPGERLPPPPSRRRVAEISRYTFPLESQCDCGVSHAIRTAHDSM